MNYTDKKKYVSLMLEQVLSGKSFEQVKTHFTEQGVSKYDISNMFYMVKNGVSSKYREQINNYLQEGTLEEHQANFAPLHDDVFTFLKEEGINSIKRKANIDVRKLVRLGVETEKIISSTTSHYFSEHDAIMEINRTERILVEEDAEAKGGSVPLGLFLIIVGGGISIYSLNNPNGGYITYGLVIYGIVVLYRGLVKNK